MLRELIVRRMRPTRSTVTALSTFDERFVIPAGTRTRRGSDQDPLKQKQQAASVSSQVAKGL